MKTETLAAAKDVALQIWALEKHLAKIAPNFRHQGMIRRLVRLEATPTEHYTDDDFFELEALRADLASDPPWKRISYPGPGGQKRVPMPSLDERRLQMGSWAEKNVDALEAGLAPYLRVPEPAPTPWRRVKAWFQSFFNAYTFLR